MRNNGPTDWVDGFLTWYQCTTKKSKASSIFVTGAAGNAGCVWQCCWAESGVRSSSRGHRLLALGPLPVVAESLLGFYSGRFWLCWDRTVCFLICGCLLWSWAVWTGPREKITLKQQQQQQQVYWKLSHASVSILKQCSNMALMFKSDLMHVDPNLFGLELWPSLFSSFRGDLGFSSSSAFSFFSSDSPFTGVDSTKDIQT